MGLGMESEGGLELRSAAVAMFWVADNSVSASATSSFVTRRFVRSLGSRSSHKDEDEELE
jgi:hypothetical protein